MRRIATLAIVLACCASLSACGSSSPQDVRASIVAAALAQKSAHWTEVHTSDRRGPTRWRADVATDSGTQWITYPPGRGTVHMVLADHVVYLRGDSAGLRSALKLTAAQARIYAGRWISIAKGRDAYPALADGLTLASLVRHVTPPVALKVVTKTPQGTPALILRGSTVPNVNMPPFPESLSARPIGEPIPASFRLFFNGGERVVGTFSKWNEPVHVHAPANSTPIATVRAS